MSEKVFPRLPVLLLWLSCSLPSWGQQRPSAPEPTPPEAPTPALETGERPTEVATVAESTNDTDTVVETVNVTAEPLGDSFSPDSISTVVVELSPTPGASTAAGAAIAVPGVSENGQGGVFQVISVRGISRQRLLTFLDGIRITSERRAGVSASFVDPTLLGEIQVSRGPASTYYGSGALGGAIQLFPRHFSRLDAGLGWDSQGDELQQTVAWGNEDVSLALAHRKAQDSETPDGEQLFSRFEQTSATASFRFDQSTKRTQDVLVVGTYGDDIGKASSDTPSRITIYPRERHALVRYQLELGDRWRARLWGHGQDLLTEASRPERGESSLVDNEALDFGGLLERRLPIESARVDGRFGVDSFSRRGVTSEEFDLSVPGSLGIRSLDEAEVDEVAAFGVLNWQLGVARFEAGSRYTAEHQVNRGSTAGSKSRNAWTGFVGGSIPFGDSVELLANLGRGLRFPSLSEQFFVGTTGRGEVVGNPDLAPETSTNFELGLRLLGRRGAVSVSAYRNSIDDYIERVELEPDVLGFVNLNSGRILGAEIDGFRAFGAASAWRLELSGHWIEGESGTGENLSDIPPHRLRTALSWSRSRWSYRTSLAWRDEKSSFGPSERSIPSAWLLEGAATVRLRDDLDLSVRLSNGLDETYYPSADDQAPLAAGRSIGVSLRYSAR